MTEARADLDILIVHRIGLDIGDKDQSDKCRNESKSRPKVEYSSLSAVCPASPKVGNDGGEGIGTDKSSNFADSGSDTV